MYTNNNQQEVQLSLTFKMLRLRINFENVNCVKGCCTYDQTMNLLLALSSAQVTGPVQVQTGVPFALTDTELLCIIAEFKNLCIKKIVQL